MLIDPGRPSARTRRDKAGRGHARRPFAYSGDAPLTGEFTVERLGDGRFTCTGRCSRAFA